MAEIVGTVWEVKQETIMVRDTFNPGQKKQSTIRRIKLQDNSEYGCWDGSLDIQQGQSYRFLIESRNQPPSQRYPQGRVFNNIIGARPMAAAVAGAPQPPMAPQAPPQAPPAAFPDEPLPQLPEGAEHAPELTASAFSVGGMHCPYCKKGISMRVDVTPLT